MPIFGYNSIGGSTQAIAANTKRFWKFTTGSTVGLVKSISAYCDRSGTGTGYAVDAAIYTDNAGAPNALVTNSSIQLASNIARNSPNWYTANYGTAPTLSPSTTYWIGVLFTKAGITYHTSGGTNQEASRADTLPFDDPFGGSPTYANNQGSCYVFLNPSPLAADKGSYSETGNAAALKTQRKITATTRVFNASGDEALGAYTPNTQIATGLHSGKFPKIAGIVISEPEISASTEHYGGYPAGCETGDLLLSFVVYSDPSSQQGDQSTWTNWTELHDKERFGVAYRIAPSALSGAYLITSADSVYASVVTVLIKNHGSSVSPPEFAITEDYTGSANPDSPNLTPTGGSKNYLWMSAAAMHAGQSSAITWPDGFFYRVYNIASSISNEASFALGSQEKTAASNNPSAYTRASNPWWAATIAVYPYAAAEKKITATVTPFDVTGISTTLLKTERRIGATVTTFEVSSPITNALVTTRKVIADLATFTETANAAALKTARIISCVVQTFTETGNDARLARGAIVAAAQGTFTLTGNDATLTEAGGQQHLTLTATVTPFTLTGNAAALKTARKIIAEGAVAGGGGGSLAKFYMRDLAASTSPTAGEKSVALDGTDLENPEDRALKSEKGSAENNYSFVAGPDTSGNFYFTRFSSDALAAQTIAAQNWTCAIAGSVSGNHFFIAYCSIYVWRPSNSSVVGFIADGQFIEGINGGSERGIVSSFSGSSVVTQSGDILVVEIWENAVGDAENDATHAFHFDGTTDPIDEVNTDDAASYVQSTNTITLAGGDGNPFLLTGNAAILAKGRAISAATGSFSETGNDAILKTARKVSATTQIFTETGNDAALRTDRKVIAIAGAFSETGNDAALKLARLILAATGAFTETGNDATLTKTGARILTASAGAFAETGNDAILKIGQVAIASTGTFAESGNDAGLKFGQLVVATTGTFALTGNQAALIRTGATILIAGTGAFTESGNAALLKTTRKILAETGAFSETGCSASLEHGQRVNASLGTFAESGNSATLRQGYRIIASAGSFSETGNAAELKQGFAIATETSTYTVSGNAAALRHNYKLLAATGEFLLTGNQAQLIRVGQTRLTAEKGIFVETGRAAGLQQGFRLICNVGSYAETGNSAALITGATLSAQKGIFTLSGNSALLQRKIRVLVNTGVFAETGNEAGLQHARKTTAGTGVYILQPNAALLRLARRLSSAAGVYILHGNDARMQTFLARIICNVGHFYITGSKTTRLLPKDNLYSAESSGRSRIVKSHGTGRSAESSGHNRTTRSKGDI